MESHQSFSARYAAQIDDIYGQVLGGLDRRMIAIAERVQISGDDYHPGEYTHINDVLKLLISSTHHIADLVGLRRDICIHIAGILSAQNDSSTQNYTYHPSPDQGYILDLPEHVSMQISHIMGSDARYGEYRQIASRLRTHAAILSDFHERMEHFAFHIIDQYTTVSYPYREMHRGDIDGEWSGAMRLMEQDAQRAVAKDSRAVRKLNISRHLEQKLKSLDADHLRVLFCDDELFNTWQKNTATAPDKYQLFKVATSLLLIMNQIDRQISQSMDPSTIEAHYVRQYVYARTVLDICTQMVYP